VGKTVVSSALLSRFAETGPLRYWKPVQTGIEEDDDTRTVEQLTGGAVLNAGVRLPRPLSPHLSARLAGQPIDVSALLSLAGRQDESERFIVEGAGGVLVPMTDEVLMIDFMRQLALPVVVVARSTLGTINHTLLTLEALRARAIPVAGVVLNGPENRENWNAIEIYGRVVVLGQLPMIAPLTREGLAREAARLDADGCLAGFMRS
jgi:dethiobiotin synthetase